MKHWHEKHVHRCIPPSAHHQSPGKPRKVSDQMVLKNTVGIKAQNARCNELPTKRYSRRHNTDMTW